MATKTIKHNIQIDDEIREMTSEEFTAYKADQKLTALLQAEANAILATRESALAKLTALGLTEEEVASL
tara:strand:+ start:319 stop:525 length:207 start_codon:yes stop_codon:yes gene_type:complete